MFVHTQIYDIFYRQERNLFSLYSFPQAQTRDAPQVNNQQQQLYNNTLTGSKTSNK